MRAWVLTLGSVLFVPVFAHAAPPNDKDQLTGNVLVWEDAAFIIDAADPQKTIQLAKLEMDRTSALGMVIPMHVVGASGDLVEVEPVDGYECVSATLRAHDLKSFRLFVDKKDLAPVVTKAYAAKYPDGTRVDIAPGVPVQPLGTGFLIPFGREQVPVAIPAASVGTSYQPHKRSALPDVSNAKLLYRIAAKATAKLGDQPFTFSDASSAVSTKIDKTKDKAVSLFPLQTACASAKVSVPANQTQSFKPERNASPSRTPVTAGSPGGDVLPIGTPLFVGTRKIAVTTTERSVVKGAPFCFALVPYIEATTEQTQVKLQAPHLEACAKADVKLVHRPISRTVLRSDVRRD